MLADSRQSYPSRAGLYLGILGAVNFATFVLIYQQDYFGRFGFMLALIPIPFVCLFLAWKKPFIGGVLLIALGVAVFLIDINFTVGIVGKLAGLGLGFTLVFVTLPLLASGVLFLLSKRKSKKITRSGGCRPLS
jgi:hypothetical protein